MRTIYASLARRTTRSISSPLISGRREQARAQAAASASSHEAQPARSIERSLDGRGARAIPRSFVAALLLSALALSACGGAQRRGERSDRPIDRLRQRALEQPNDRALALELSIAEHLYDGGEPERARLAVAHAKQPGSPKPEDELTLAFIEAEQHVLEGEPPLALEGYLSLLERAAGSRDPRAPLYAELALDSIIDMNDATDDYRPRVEKALATLAPRADSLGLTAAHQLRMALSVSAMQHGDAASAVAHARAAGCVQQLEVAGPFGPRELLGFDRTLPPEQAGPLAREYDLGPGRDVQQVRTLETRRCTFGLGRGAHDPLPGTTIARAELETAAGNYALRIESPNSYALFVDGRELARVDLRSRHAEGVRYIPIALSAGKHELKLKVSSRHPNPVLSIALVQAEQPTIAATVLPAPKSELDRFLIAKLALARGAAVEARELVRKLGHRSPTAHWLVLEAATAIADPLKSAEARRDRARELLTRAEQQNPRAWYPSIGIARLASAEGRAKEAIDALRAAVAKWPQAISIRTSLIEQLRASGYVEEAERIGDELAKELPHACAVIGNSLASARSRGRMSDVARYTEQAMACDATSSARLSLLKLQRKYEAAAAELARLELLGEPLDSAQALETELERARLSGDREKERKLREQRTSVWFDRPEPVLDRADLLLAGGDKRGALAYLSSALQKSPAELHDLRRVQEALSPDELFKGYRKRTDDVIRAFEASKQTYDEPQVLVLDYTAVRLFEDGSSVSLTHNIVRVQSQEAVDEHGEFSVPDGARLLSLHTRKADGTRLEPDLIPGKASWSMPNLAPGDYVESEYVRGESPSAGFPGGYLGDRFYFKSFEVPFDHSELVVVLPAGTEPVLDPRGPLPELVKESRDGLTVLRWTARQSRSLSPEPSSIAAREFLPSINLGLRVSWEAYVESLRDLLVDKDVYDPAAQEFVLELLGARVNQPKSTRAAALYRWVTEQIEPTTEVFGSAPAMLSARTGSRERVLKYMLALAGIESELVLVRGLEADHLEAALPDPETFGHLLLRVDTERGPTFVHTGARHASFGYLPAQVRGELGLVVNARTERTTTPPDEPERELRNVDIEIALANDGKSKVHVVERHRGASAVSWRNDLDAIPAAELSTRFEQSYAANVIPGAKLQRLAVHNREDENAPLVLDYELDVDDLGQRTGNTQRISGLFTAELSSRFARQGSRTTTALIAPSLAVDVRTQLALPKGARLVALPKGGTLSHPSKASFSVNTEAREQNVIVTRSLRLPSSRVEPAAYAPFAAFCRAVDALEGSDLVIDFAQ
jgi:cellulose synthase operon protein C